MFEGKGSRKSFKDLKVLSNSFLKSISFKVNFSKYLVEGFCTCDVQVFSSEFEKFLKFSVSDVKPCHGEVVKWFLSL